jgi:hypothetical protein
MFLNNNDDGFFAFVYHYLCEKTDPFMNRNVNELPALKSLWKPNTSYTAKIDATALSHFKAFRPYG